MSSSVPGNHTLRERQVFDPDSIKTALLSDLPGGLRAIADAIEAGDISGKMLTCAGIGVGYSWRDTRAHIHVSVDLAAEVYRWSGREKTALPEQPTLLLPAANPETVENPPKYSLETKLIIGLFVTFLMGLGGLMVHLGGPR